MLHRRDENLLATVLIRISDAFEGELLSPTQDDLQSIGGNADQKLSPEFIELMLRLMPYVRMHMTGELTMSQLSVEAKMDVVSCASPDCSVLPSCSRLPIRV